MGASAFPEYPVPSLRIKSLGSNGCTPYVTIALYFLPGHEMVLDCGFQSDPGGTGSATAVHNRLLSASPWRLCCPLSLISDHRCSNPQHSSYCAHMVGVQLPRASPAGDSLSSPCSCFWECELILFLLVFPVLTSCASLHMTPMKRCTGCCSWPSVRVARASACSDHSCHLLDSTLSRASGHRSTSITTDLSTHNH